MGLSDRCMCLFRCQLISLVYPGSMFMVTTSTLSLLIRLPKAWDSSSSSFIICGVGRCYRIWHQTATDNKFCWAMSVRLMIRGPSDKGINYIMIILRLLFHFLNSIFGHFIILLSYHRSRYHNPTFYHCSMWKDPGTKLMLKGSRSLFANWHLSPSSQCKTLWSSWKNRGNLCMMLTCR